MPELIIDDRDIEVPEGTKIIEAAEQLGIMIPRFCYHPALGAVGACRVCAVKFLQGPFKGVQMSCMIDARDGMVVSTTDAEAVEFRRYVIEWLMLHHPHDCPVCDEGGHCLLQDMTISGGHGIRRYLGQKRTYADQDLGPLVQHEMNRCIHCYRCSRFYQEFAGYRDLGVLQIANRIFFGRSAPGVLESPFCGNLSDICPTGVYTDKPSRYKGRRWDYERTPAICGNCSLGCHIVVSARYREIVRHEARFSPTVNGHFICDRGRFGFYYTNDPARPRQARVDGQFMQPDVGLAETAARLDAIAGQHGPAAVACIGGLRSSLETQAALYRLTKSRKWQGPVFFSDPGQKDRVAAAVGRLSEDLAVSLRQIERADAVVVIGADPLNDAPMLALALRQAQRKGAGVAVVDPRPVVLPCDFAHVPIHPAALCRALGRICRQAVAAGTLRQQSAEFYRALENLAPFEPPLEEKLNLAAELLRKSRRPVVVCGTDLAVDSLSDLAADAVLLAKADGKDAGLFYVLPGAGAFGAALFDDGSLEDILDGIEAGDIRALVVAEADPLFDCPDRGRLEKSLDSLELLVVLDYLDSAVSQRARVLLPAATRYEAGGHAVNQEGRLQWSPAACRGGQPIVQTGGGDHPPRIYAADIPGGGLPPAAKVLAAAAGYDDPLGIDGALKTAVEAFAGLKAPVMEQPLPEEGLRLAIEPDPSRPFDPDRLSNSGEAEDGLQLVLTEQIFGTEALSVRSACLEKVTPAPCVYLHPVDAAGLGLADGDPVVIETEQGRLQLAVRLIAQMAAGVLVLPRHVKAGWQIFDSAAAVLRRGQIKPAGGQEMEGSND